ncbi:hypothetical protein OESDEN_10475 [Oesophagostomum dentatum]|uniref:LBP / BPI / CETP family protein n=1 Tax=Oesophagostomum dentatum TaxID=61180 RepID=A0A0B1T1Q0_OESDE|nr:hypothetical protein OESDEN_10475 [Oesophagostomum dentatum]
MFDTLFSSIDDSAGMCLSTVFLVSESSEAKINIDEPITVSVTPKIWRLLETKGHIINSVLSSIQFPEFDGKEHLVKYRVWGGRIEHFHVPSSGVTFQDVNNGVRIRISGVQFAASVNGRVEIGKKVFGKWVRIARMSGEIKAKSENVNMEVNLVWNDFNFIPTVTMSSNVRVDFTRHLRTLNFLRSRVQKMVNSKVNSEVPRKASLVDAIQGKVNPRLQKLKQKVADMGITHYGLDWRIQNKILYVTLKTKNNGEVSTVESSNKMICIDASILDALQLLNRKKRGLGKKLRKLRDKIFGRKREGSNPPPPPPPTSPTPPVITSFSSF